MGRKYPTKDVKLLWGLAAGRCAFPNCKVPCIASASEYDSAVVLGKIAHIVAHSDDGPRADPSMPPDDRDKYDNWILLCAAHHDLVDAQANTYTVSALIDWKNSHEEWVRSRLVQAIPSVGFAELEMITQSIINVPVPTSNTIDFHLTNPVEKLAKNDLTNRTYFKITMGLSKAQEVQDFVEKASTLDPTFPERLRNSFMQEYERLKSNGLSGDALFESLHQFACPPEKTFEYQAAGIAVIAYLFEKCDIFER